MSVKGTDVKQKNDMNSKDLSTFGKSKCASPLINEESFSKMKKVHTYLKEHGVKVATYDTVITNCGSCGNWSSKQKCS